MVDILIGHNPRLYRMSEIETEKKLTVEEDYTLSYSLFMSAINLVVIAPTAFFFRSMGMLVNFMITGKKTKAEMTKEELKKTAQGMASYSYDLGNEGTENHYTTNEFEKKTKNRFQK